MDEKIKNLWANNKILFFLLLPLILIVMFRNVLIELLVASGNKIMGDATKKSNDLKSEADIANAKADQIISDSDKAAKEKLPVGEDWNKR